MYEYAIAPGWWHGIAPLHFGYEECEPAHIFGPAVRNYFLLHYVLEGEGTFCKDGKTLHLQQGDLFVICPEDVTTYQASAENPWKYAWVGFQAEQTPDFLKVPVIRQAPVRQDFEWIRNRSEYWDIDGMVFSITYDLLWRLSQNAPNTADLPGSYAAYAKTYLDTTYMRQVSIQEIADVLHIDRRYLTVLFKAAYGIPPKTYLMQLRMNQAKDFLHRGYGVTETATMAGFSDLSNFSRQYKIHFGVSPSKQLATEEHLVD